MATAPQTGLRTNCIMQDKNGLPSVFKPDTFAQSFTHRGTCRTKVARGHMLEDEPPDPRSNNSIVIGIDVGSTTVKAVVIDPATREILSSAYERHETRQAEKVFDQLTAIHDRFRDQRLLDQLAAIGDAFHEVPTSNMAPPACSGQAGGHRRHLA